MVAELTYDVLVETVLAWINRDDPVLIQQMPNIVMLAQKKISYDISILGQTNYIEGNFLPPQMNSSQNMLDKPPLWRNTLSFAVGGSINGGTTTDFIQLELVQFDFLKNYWPDQTALGTPKFYADMGNNKWIVAPTPDQNYPILIAFTEIFPNLSETNQQNWLSNNLPHLLFYQTLYQALIFSQYDARAPGIEAIYENLKTAVIANNKERVTDRFVVRDKD